jgi:glucose/mannose-6-phosphate isomerase
MLACLQGLPQQVRTAWQSATEFEIPEDYARAENVVVLGMGGSAIGGDLVGSLVASEATVPVIVRRDYDLPAFVNEKTLVIASSNSGNTEETLSAFDQALRTPARKLVSTRGGRLKGIAEENGIPVFTYDFESQPRAAVGFGFLPILCFMQKLGFIGDRSAEVAEAVGVMEGLVGRIDDAGLDAEPGERNAAKQLARKALQKLPVIYGGGYLSEAAHRWKTQINENSKAWAFYEAFPELNHNAVVGYQFPAELAGSIIVVMLRSSRLHGRILRRYEVTCQLLERAGISYEVVDAEGDSALSHLLSLVLFGDYVSYYLALLNRTDPTPVEAIDFLKQQLAAGA